MILKTLIKFPILKRLIPSIYKKYIYFTDRYIVRKKIDGIIYLLDTRHLIDRNFYLRENYEDILFLSAKKLIISNKINFFLDIGSCWGIYSLRLSKIKKLKILSFDPIKKNISRLREMITINNLKNIKIYNTALGNKKGIVKLFGDADFTPNYSIYEKNQKNMSISKINKLDNIVKIKKKNLYLKVDIEGHEYSFIIGAKNIFLDNNVILQIELLKENKSKVFKYLSKYKFYLINSYQDDYIFSNFKLNNQHKFKH